ncbi:hypothetical protein GCM10010435_25910 [Winogradskya consettensis]|uniref:Uncharacterized protein n=1 Tax=Winogradskya consettensis TaxID=113560 RepID=A0A919SBK2_9ACTN|nr:hypothetical protein Aco04nite_08700 [Actinoplanes consettensis]
MRVEERDPLHVDEHLLDAGLLRRRPERVGERGADTHVELAAQAHQQDAVVRRLNDDLIVVDAHNAHV